MRSKPTPVTIVVFASLLSGGTAGAAVSADIAARIEFGYYSRDRSVLSAAVDELRNDDMDDPSLRYLLAYAHFRLAEDAGAEASRTALLLCADAAADVAEARPRAADPLVLLAVCSWQLMQLEPLKGIVHERRMRRALTDARARDRDNPRLALLEAWQLMSQQGGRTAYRARLEAAVAAFRRAEPTAGFLGWGEAEAFTLLAAEYLAARDWRAARDAIEHALLVAPDYWRAVSLQREIPGAADYQQDTARPPGE